MNEINDHCQCDNCSGRDCGQDDPDLYLEQKIQDEEKHDEQVREEERERVLNAIFPKPTQSDLKNGWEYNYRFIEKISDRTKELSEDDACMEVVMVVLKTLEESLRTDKVEP